MSQLLRQRVELLLLLLGRRLLLLLLLLIENRCQICELHQTVLIEHILDDILQCSGVVRLLLQLMVIRLLLCG